MKSDAKKKSSTFNQFIPQTINQIIINNFFQIVEIYNDYLTFNCQGINSNYCKNYSEFVLRLWIV